MAICPADTLGYEMLPGQSWKRNKTALRHTCTTSAKAPIHYATAIYNICYMLYTIVCDSFVCRADFERCEKFSILTLS